MITNTDCRTTTGKTDSLIMKKHTTDELINKLRLNKLESEYGTPEYWAKERRSKFIINARQKDLLNRRLEFGILNL